MEVSSQTDSKISRLCLFALRFVGFGITWAFLMAGMLGFSGNIGIEVFEIPLYVSAAGTIICLGAAVFLRVAERIDNRVK